MPPDKLSGISTGFSLPSLYYQPELYETHTWGCLHYQMIVLFPVEGSRSPMVLFSKRQQQGFSCGILMKHSCLPFLSLTLTPHKFVFINKYTFGTSLEI